MKAHTWSGGITTLSLTSALDVVARRRYALAALTAAMTRYLEAGLVWTGTENHAPTGSDPLTVQLSRPTH